MTRSSAGAPEEQVLAGRYEIGAVLGRGAMAEVRAGWDTRLGRAVAIKTLLPDLAEEPGVRRRFEGEARAAARLAHPNAVAVFDVGEEGGVPFMVMEQVLGPTLEEELRLGPLDAERLRRLGGELLAALGAAHHAGLVHRDVKPANVLLAPDGSAKVADFGIAKAVVDDETATRQMDLTTAGHTPGTVAYMAPERLAGQPASVQSDLYSVGVVLYESLTGTRPFAAPTPIAIIRAIDQARPAPLHECCPGLDPGLVATVERAMAKNPEDRFASAAEMSVALRTGGLASTDATEAAVVLDATSVVPIQAAAIGPPAGRHRVAVLAAVVALAVAGLTARLIALAAGGNPEAPPVEIPTVTSTVTSAVTSPPTTLLPAPPPETPTSTATTKPAGGKVKGKGKE